MKYMISTVIVLLMIVYAVYEGFFKSSTVSENVVVTLPEVEDVSFTLPEPEPTYEPFVIDDDFELELSGSTGIAPVMLPLYKDESMAEKVMDVSVGTIFMIERQVEDLWYVRVGDKLGWISHQYCLINLPDVIPSIVYDGVNTYDARYRSSGISIPGITGEALYMGKSFNERLSRDEYVMPVLYETAKKINKAQEQALSEGNTLVIHEAYRPYDVQRRIVDAVRLLSESHETVRKGISEPPWNISWFIFDGVSNHQEGYAVDLTLAKIKDYELLEHFMVITDYDVYPMHTPFHELSIESSIFNEPVNSKTDEAWRTKVMRDDLTEGTKLLQKYMTLGGMTPLASEWWHFNDVQAMNDIEGYRGIGDFTVTEIVSRLKEE